MASTPSVPPTAEGIRYRPGPSLKPERIEATRQAAGPHQIYRRLMIGRFEPGSKTVQETRLLLLRHAETSAPDRFHGAESDIGLGERGLKQAEDVARVLAAEHADILYTSAMKRAAATAKPIGEACGLTPIIVPALHERKMGPLSGLTREEGLEEFRIVKYHWMNGELKYTHQGGESFQDVQTRIVPIFEDIVSKSPGKTIIVVTHGVVIRVFLTSVLEGRNAADFDTFAIDNVALNDLRRDGERWKAVILNRRIGAGHDDFAW